MFATIDINTFCPASFVKFPWHCWTEFNESCKDLRKTLRSHEKLQSLKADLKVANTGIHSNSKDWLFSILMMFKINPLMNKRVLFWIDVLPAFSILVRIEYIYLYQNCTESVVVISSNVMWNIRNEVEKPFLRTKKNWLSDM